MHLLSLLVEAQYLWEFAASASNLFEICQQIWKFQGKGKQGCQAVGQTAQFCEWYSHKEQEKTRNSEGKDDNFIILIIVKVL